MSHYFTASLSEQCAHFFRVVDQLKTREGPATASMHGTFIGLLAVEIAAVRDRAAPEVLEAFRNDAAQVARTANAQAVAKGAGTPLPELPVLAYKWDDPLPPSWGGQKRRSFELKHDIRRTADGVLYTGAKAEGATPADPIVYRRRDIPTTMGEAALFRTANQGKSLDPARYPATGGRFPVGGSTNTPIIKPPKTSFSD